MNQELIKVGYLVSYDFKYMENSLPTVYEYADQITLAIDKDYTTWSGQKFEVPESFFEWVKNFDVKHKIKIYTESFYVPELSAMECETRERNLLAKFMGDGGWHIQVDCDEYFLDFKAFVNFLKSLDMNNETTIYAEWITIFKYDESDMFIIDANEVFPLGTNKPIYKVARTTKKQTNIYTDFKVLHQSWGRSEEELSQKLSTWGHKEDFNTDAYFDLWKAINKYTYKYIYNFHPLDDGTWRFLECIEAKNIEELISKMQILKNQEEDHCNIKQIKKRKGFFSFLSGK